MASATSSPGAEGARRGFRLRLRTVVLLLNAVVLVLPIGASIVLRLYDNQVIRQTEAELIAQGVFVAEAYRVALLKQQDPPPPGKPLSPEWQRTHSRPDGLRPIPPALDVLRQTVLPAAEGPLPAQSSAAPAAVLAGEDIMTVLRSAQLTTLAGVRVVDPAGIVVASTREELGESLAHRQEIRRALQGENVSLLRQRTSDTPAPPLSSISRSSGLRVFVAMPIVHSGQVLGAVVLARTPNSLGKAFYQDRYALVATGALMIAVVLIISVLTATMIVRPMKALVAQSRQVAAGSGDAALEPIANPVTEEVGELSIAFSELAKTLKARADYIRSFASHVSHEFKTPLSAIRGAIELLEEHWSTMSEPDRKRFLRNISEDNERLERLVRKLLELARADAYRPADESCEALAVAREVAERQREHGLSVQVEMKGAESIRAAISHETLESILTSLVDNVRAHAGVSAKAFLTIESLPQEVRIQVRDTGPGISEANARRIFDPFFTTARASGSTGLGLSIARSLLAAHGGSITLEPASEGALFQILLPTAR